MQKVNEVVFLCFFYQKLKINILIYGLYKFKISLSLSLEWEIRINPFIGDFLIGDKRIVSYRLSAIKFSLSVCQLS